MSIESIAAIAANFAAVPATAAAGPVASAAPQLTAHQTAQFTAQLQSPAAGGPGYYGAPLSQTAGLGSDLHSMLDYAGQVSLRFSADMQHPALPIDAQSLPPELQEELQLQQDLSARMASMNKATLEFQLIGKGVELAENIPKTLYQQS